MNCRSDIAALEERWLNSVCLPFHSDGFHLEVIACSESNTLSPIFALNWRIIEYKCMEIDLTSSYLAQGLQYLLINVRYWRPQAHLCNRRKPQNWIISRSPLMSIIIAHQFSDMNGNYANPSNRYFSISSIRLMVRWTHQKERKKNTKTVWSINCFTDFHKNQICFNKMVRRCFILLFFPFLFIPSRQWTHSVWVVI